VGWTFMVDFGTHHRYHMHLTICIDVLSSDLSGAARYRGTGESKSGTKEPEGLKSTGPSKRFEIPRSIDHVLQIYCLRYTLRRSIRVLWRDLRWVRHGGDKDMIVV
jgi:hypothetical protein